jgi:hypothetical protein
MGDAPSVSAKTNFQDSSLDRRPARRGFFAALLEALHHSRRLQAKRAIRQYSHLIDRTGYRISGESNAHSGEDHDARK